MSKSLRWGLLSTANINKALIGPLRASSRSKLAAVASRDQARAQAYAQEYEIPKAYGSYEALIEDPDIDVIYNPLPNNMHCVWTVRAGVRYRVPAAAVPYVDVTTDPRLYGTPIPLATAQLCYLIEPTGSRT